MQRIISRTIAVVAGCYMIKYLWNAFRNRNRPIPMVASSCNSKDNLIPENVHVVRPGDTLDTISREFKIKSSEILELNPGCELRVPIIEIKNPWLSEEEREAKRQEEWNSLDPGCYHQIKPGERLREIALVHNVAVDDLISINHIKDHLIFAGRHLRLPPATTLCIHDVIKC